MARKVLVTKVTKGGFGRKVNSEFGYASFDIATDALEVMVDPPLDLSVEEDREAYKKLQESLSKMVMKQLEDNTSLYRSRNEELDMSLAKREAVVHKAKGEQ